MKIETYQLLAQNGRPIRKATKVTLGTGRVIYFMEKMTRKQVLAQVI